MSMKALVYNGPGKREFKQVPIPKIESSKDAVIKLEATTICGTDLHIFKGDVPEVKEGTILGHEGIGRVHEVGSDVTKFKVGDRVLVACITACGSCVYCKKNLQSHCLDGGWILGHNINGTQAEYTRIPYADNSLHNVEKYEGKVSDEALLMISDAMPTGNEIGALNGQITEGDVVAIVGAGGIGSSALVAVKSFNPGLIIVIDPDEERLRVAKEKFGADVGINPTKVDVVEEISKLVATVNVGERANLTNKVDVAIEAVGIPQTFDTCQNIIAPGGRIANVGVHGKAVNFNIQDLWSQNITLATGLVNAYSIPELLEKVASNRADPSGLVTHKFTFDQMEESYETFGDASKNKCIKVFVKF
ncbi:L-threonine 3-dehydrogenase [Wickerhamomyces ciferrii]|uniref:L-threonine 3-dehydrogenase n=1 Tax=Wickerhamomyces ciferrii (strain ATCC 14091 / BCRC 22168 / CBS 111 / JCM 3599 / NBRC 0793 / NRRL Y-1031 F-60-10) TaxID=1206466 RepID=K0KFG1_WICCF|nr:L-threonine 3-dehydrogenase [Wickerhamomyces ciferrii]CCH43860.1 L-threonine 3-dehydrogenase [Wickerhamomyces ciferrii]